jgi:phosphomannomutase
MTFAWSPMVTQIELGQWMAEANYLSTHQLICLLLHHLFINRKQQGRVVKALTTTTMVDKMCAAYRLQLVETGVGFKYIAAEMIKGGVLLGLKKAVALASLATFRNGTHSGRLMLLEMLACERISINKLISNLTKEFGPHYYDRNDIHFPLEKRQALMEFLQKNPPPKLSNSALAEIKLTMELNSLHRTLHG